MSKLRQLVQLSSAPLYVCLIAQSFKIKIIRSFFHRTPASASEQDGRC